MLTWNSLAATHPAVVAPSASVDEVRIVETTPEWLQRWQSLEARLEAPWLSCSSIWTRTWLKHYGDLVPHRIAVGLQGAQINGMCLLTNGVAQHDGPFPVKSLHIGTAGEPEVDSACVEYNRLLTSPQHRQQFVRKLIETINRHESWECFMLNGMVPEDAAAFMDVEAPAEFDAVPSHYCDLNTFRDAPAEPWRMFGISTRSNLRRSLRDLGKISFDWAENVDTALEYFEEMIGYHQARWQAVGKPGAFSSPRFTNFHCDLIAALVPFGKATVVRARQGDRVLGILYLLIEQNRLLYYQAGLPDHHSRLSLGNVTQYLTMLEGARRGYDAFDFLAGDAQYKRVLSTHQNTIYWARWRKPSVKFLVLNGLRSLKNCWHG